jgi:demethylmenaquinone methyltransferase/2-methoxy-6-polyprenyl-1,4-benzoquinol methylase
MSQTASPHHESNRAFYDRISQAYDLIADANERQARLTGLHALDLKPGERVLGVGFGTGNEVLDLANLVGPRGGVSGIDISPGMLAVAQRKLEQKPPPAHVELRVGDARQLPYGDAAFDAVYSSFTLELFPAEDLPVVLAEVRRVLREGGKVGAVSMAKVKPGEKPSILEDVYVWMHRHFPHIVDCRPIDLPALLRAAGFRVTKKIDLAIWSMPVAAVVAEKGPPAA